jgi:hypothetical protein
MPEPSSQHAQRKHPPAWLASWTTGRALSAAVLCLLPLVYFAEAVLGRVALVQGDGWTANLGLRILTGQLLAQGTLPLWNPYLFGGMPLLASVYPGVLYPPNWLFALLPPGIAMNLVVISTFHLALFGAYRYARCLGCARAAALVTSLSFGFGGYMVMSLGQTSNIAAAAWLPWMLLALEKLYQQPSWRWVALGAGFITLQFFAGVPQMTWHTTLTGGAYFLFSLLVRERLVPRRRFAVSVGLMALSGLLLSAVQFLPVRELQQLSGRVALTYEQFAEFSFPARQAGALLLPFIFGGATMPPYRLPYWGETGIYVTCGYVGLLTVLLAAVAVLAGRREKLVWFWAGWAGLALLLAFGSQLPFELNRLLYHVPVNNLFRASFRHMHEFTLALAVLAGLGLQALGQRPAAARLGAWCKCWALLGGLFALAVLTVPAQARAFTNPELLLPLALLLLSVSALWAYARLPGPRAQVGLLAVLFLDLAVYGYALEWRAYPYQMFAKLADPPAVQFIKQRETAWHSFRILSFATQPFGPNYSELNAPNLSLARGLASVNGYDMLRLAQPAEILGGMTPEGVVTEAAAFGRDHRGFDLLNVKYLLRECGQPLGAAADVIHEGVRFAAPPLDLQLGPGHHGELSPGGAPATELVLVTTLANSTHLPDGATLARIRLRLADGRMENFELQAGRDSAEWAYERDDVKAVARHQRAHVIERWPAAGFAGQRYLARFRFARGSVERIELEYARQDAALVVFRAALFDAAHGVSYHVTAPSLAVERWRKLGGFGAVDVYENLSALPRAWVANRVIKLAQAEIVQTIKQGRLPNGEPFDPRHTALLEQDGQAATLEMTVDTQTAQVQLVKYTPQEIELAVSNAQPGWLILSEIDYPGWTARLDNQPVEVQRVNLVLRGVALNSGVHRVRFQFHSKSLQLGMGLSLLGLLLLGLVKVTRLV